MNLEFIKPQNSGSLLMKLSQSNFNLPLPGSYLVRSYLITTVLLYYKQWGTKEILCGPHSATLSDLTCFHAGFLIATQKLHDFFRCLFSLLMKQVYLQTSCMFLTKSPHIFKICANADFKNTGRVSQNNRGFFKFTVYGWWYPHLHVNLFRFLFLSAF